MAAHAYSVLDSYIYGFALQQSDLPFTHRSRSPRWRRASSGSSPPTSTRTSPR